VIAERSFERIAGERAEIGIDFLDVEALEAAGFVGGEFESALAFDEDFAGFALRVFEGENGCSGFGVGERTLHGDEEFVAEWPRPATWRRRMPFWTSLDSSEAR